MIKVCDVHFGQGMRFGCSVWGLLSNNPHLFKIKKRVCHELMTHPHILELVNSAKRNVASININSECRRVISVLRRIASVSEEANL